MSLLDRKVLRDLWALRGQVATIATLVAAGVAVLIGSVSSYVSLVEAAETYYQTSRFADIWADVKRAPRSLLPKIEAIPGVGVVEPRIVKDVRINWPQSETAVSGRMISIPDHGRPALNDLAIVLGRALDPAQRNEAIVNAAFAESWRVRPGDAIDVILNGRAQRFRIVGVAYSPPMGPSARLDAVISRRIVFSPTSSRSSGRWRSPRRPSFSRLARSCSTSY